MKKDASACVFGRRNSCHMALLCWKGLNSYVEGKEYGVISEYVYINIYDTDP
jgi:hypothetical protein